MYGFPSVFARAKVCNVFFFARLFYVPQVLPCARENIQSFHRVFSRFIRRSGSQPMRRDNIQKCAIMRYETYSSVYSANNFRFKVFFFRDQDHPFFRAIIHTCLRTHQKRSFLVTTHDDISARLMVL